MTQIRVRAALVEGRTALVNAARGFAKALGERLPECDADTMAAMAELQPLAAAVREALRPLLAQIAPLTEEIKRCDGRLEELAARYPETRLLRQVNGVGPLIALTYVLTLEEAGRFHRSRDAGCYVGLRPKRRESGESRPQLGISKEGDRYLRALLVQGAHCVLKQKAPDTDLKRWGVKLAGRGGKNAKKRAVVAVARRLAVLLHRLWATGEVYEPLRNTRAREAAAKKKAA